MGIEWIETSDASNPPTVSRTPPQQSYLTPHVRRDELKTPCSKWDDKEEFFKL